MAMTALLIQPHQSALLCSKADCDVAAVPSAVQSAGRCSVCHFAHARSTMPHNAKHITIDFRSHVRAYATMCGSK